MRIVIFALGAIIVFVASALAVFFLYSPVVPRKSLQEFHLSEAGSEGHPTLIVEGRLLGGMMAIHNATQYQRGRGIVLLVRAGITRSGLRGATFHYEIQIPNDVDEISFGGTDDVIWRRKR